MDCIEKMISYGTFHNFYTRVSTNLRFYKLCFHLETIHEAMIHNALESLMDPLKWKLGLKND